MSKVGIMKNNKGAALVMVILAMMFVGILAAVALTITVGNSKSTKATIDTSENFYSSENVLNDLEMYLKKLATSSATEAYAKTLSEIGTVVDIDARFDELFAEEIEKTLKARFAGIETGSYTADTSKIQEICFNRFDLSDPSNIPVKISFGGIDTTGNKITLKNVVISLLEEGYENTITTDITFSAKMPRTGTLDTSEDFNYEIDHYLIISGKDIKPVGYSATPFTRGAMSGNLTGNIYAYNDLIIQTSEGGKVGINSNYIIVGKNIIVDKAAGASGNGTLEIAPINNTRIISKLGTIYDANVWADNFKVYDGNVKLLGVDSGNIDVNTYLGGNLELNGNAAEFILESGSGSFIGYSYKSINNTVISSTLAPKSSAIILNGLGAKLDLSRLSTLKLSGTAYTAISDLLNVEALFSSYDGNSSANLNYYTQGESITYRALQALYLIPGDCIKTVGHNPMTVQDILNATGKTNISDLNLYGLTVTVPDYLKDYINVDDPYTAQYVRYVGSGASIQNSDKIYLFWNFKTKAKAVDYFNKIIKSDEDSFSGKGLSEKQIRALYDKNGYIKLPSAEKCDLYGNGIYYSSSLKTVPGKGTVTESYDSSFGSLKSYAVKSKTDNNKNLLANMFPNDRLKALFGTSSQLVEPLVGPLDNRLDSEGNALQFELKNRTSYKDDSGNLLTTQIEYNDTEYSKTRHYKLVTGANISWSGSFEPDTTYIFVTPGNVVITTTDTTNGFRGMIIAGGDVSLPDGLKMECLGMLSYVPSVAGVPQDQIDTTEFKALLDVVIYDSEGNEDPTTSNYKLRQIFNLADTSAVGGSGNGDDFVTLETNNWKRN